MGTALPSSPDTYTIPHHPPKLQLVHFSSTQHQTAPSTVSKKSEIFQSINMSFQDKAQTHITQIDKELSKYPVLNNLEKQTSVPKVYAFLGLIATYFFFIFFNKLEKQTSVPKVYAFLGLIAPFFFFIFFN